MAVAYLETAKRLQTVVEDGFVARLGGDEFVVALIATLQDGQKKGKELSDAIIETINKPYRIGDLSDWGR
ncbi:Diguanylate cyclase, GGDEF domain [Paenibacillus algorifonticola]|uniref:Diguanylate cyclase, GGDEF domain n=1 Tax=Paenibacillus algorifonticola TaxID=684063 RepID=A0A1I2A4E0_9BACL|nr:Diguanylate cyclase, GGDEF domain [Paenibacillus algorifonticola]